MYSAIICAAAVRCEEIRTTKSNIFTWNQVKILLFLLYKYIRIAVFNTGETEHQKSKICEEVNAEDDNDV